MIRIPTLRLRRRRAQGMTEYIVIVGLIAIVLIGAVKKFQGALNKTYEKTTNELTSIQNEIDAKGPKGP
ncbi:MAG: Flp family type IVb pilin [Planctomycetota bacterium]